MYSVSFTSYFFNKFTIYLLMEELKYGYFKSIQCSVDKELAWVD